MRILSRLACLALPALLAACSGGASRPEAAAVPGTTMRSIQGAPSAAEPLRPEPGNIWSDGLPPAAPAR